MSVLRPMPLAAPPVLLIGAGVAVQFLPWRFGPAEHHWLFGRGTTPLHRQVHDAYGYPFTVLRVAPHPFPGMPERHWHPDLAILNLVVLAVAVLLAAVPLMFLIRRRRLERLDWETPHGHHAPPRPAPPTVDPPP